MTIEKQEDVETLGYLMEVLFASLDEDPNEWKEEFMTMNFFDDLSAELLTDFGILTVDGEDLRMEIFDTAKGIVTLCGSVRALDYYDTATSSDTKKKRGLFGKKTGV